MASRLLDRVTMARGNQPRLANRDPDDRTEEERTVGDPDADHEDVEEARLRARQDADESYDDMVLDDDELDLDRMAEPQGPDA